MEIKRIIGSIILNWKDYNIFLVLLIITYLNSSTDERLSKELTQVYESVYTDDNLSNTARDWFENLIKDYQGKKQFNIDSFYKATEDDVNLDEFYEYAPLNEQELQTKISSYVKKIDNELIRKIVFTIFINRC